MRLKILRHLKWVKAEGCGNAPLYQLHSMEVPQQVFARIEKMDAGYKVSLGISQMNGYPGEIIAKWETRRAHEPLANRGVMTHLAEKELHGAKDAASWFVVEHRNHIQILIVEKIQRDIAAMNLIQAQRQFLSVAMEEAGDLPSYSPDNYRQGVWVGKEEDAPAGLRASNSRYGRSY